MPKETIHIVGAGLAGSECAFQLAERGFQVHLHEMRGETLTPAHKTKNFAELVCSNSFGSQTDYSAPGQLKWEAERLGSLILKAAQEASVPAGMALAVDREAFSNSVTQVLKAHPRIQVSTEVVKSLDDLPRPLVIATGPLTEGHLAMSMAKHFDSDFLYFFDAIAPIIDADSIDMNIAWKGDRHGKGTNDYINCPLNKDEYYELINAITLAKKIEPKAFESTPYFDGCMPIEVMVERGVETLRFGPLSQKGLVDPRTGKEPYAVVQLRQDNKAGTAFNMVGFQTKMAYADQKEVFRKIPGLAQAEFLKLGSIHRNLYIHSPSRLTPFLASRKDPLLFFAGQITGVEGYFESTCMGLLVAKFLNYVLTHLDNLNFDSLKSMPAEDYWREFESVLPPRATALGSLINALTEPKEKFQPTNINFGLFPPIDFKEVKLAYKNLKPSEDKMLGKRALKRDMQVQKAQQAFSQSGYCLFEIDANPTVD